MNSFVDMTALLARCRPSVGRVFLVGAGPGDPDLLTLRAARLLAQADVLVYDHLVGDGVLELVNTHAERIYVGKERSYHSMAHAEINALLVQHAPAAVADAFCRSRLGSAGHHNVGALPRGTDCGAIIARAWPGAS